MPSFSNAHVESLLADARLAFANAQSDATLHDPLAAYGIDDAYIARGVDLVEAAQSAYDAFQDEWDDVTVANQRLAAVESTAKAVYARHLTLARTAVDASDPAYTRLGLDGPRKWMNRSSWTNDARKMYRNLRDDAAVRDAVAPFPIDAEEGLSALEALEQAVNDRQTERSEAEQSTETRDAAVGELRGYLSDFLTVAEIAFADAPQQLEKLGKTAPSDS